MGPAASSGETAADASRARRVSTKNLRYRGAQSSTRPGPDEPRPPSCARRAARDRAPNDPLFKRRSLYTNSRSRQSRAAGAYSRDRTSQPMALMTAKGPSLLHGFDHLIRPILGVVAGRLGAG